MTPEIGHDRFRNISLKPESDWYSEPQCGLLIILHWPGVLVVQIVDQYCRRLLILFYEPTEVYQRRAATICKL